MGVLLTEISRGVCCLLFGRLKSTSLFAKRQVKLHQSPTSTARCSAVFPSLSCLFIIDENMGVWHAYRIISYLFFVTATWRKVLPRASRKLAQPGHFKSKMMTDENLPAKAATCMGNDPFCLVDMLNMHPPPILAW